VNSPDNRVKQAEGKEIQDGEVCSLRQDDNFWEKSTLVEEGYSADVPAKFTNG
jgi:hypothetical protein